MLQFKRFVQAFVILSLVFFTKFSLAENEIDFDTRTALTTYVRQNTVNTAPKLRFTMERGGLDIRVYDFCSQIWKGIKVCHQLYTAVPKSFLSQRESKVDQDNDVTQAFYAIAGGSWRQKNELPPTNEEKKRFAEKFMIYRMIANEIDGPIAVIRQVPFQKIPDGPCKGLKEDAAISCTFIQYLETGDPTWILLLQMTKSAVEGMHVAQQIFADDYGINVGCYTVNGTSKRGWTTWLTAKAEPDLTCAFSPIVIEIHSLDQQAEHQLEAWGDYSIQVQDYVERGIFEHFKTPRGQKLLEIVDPASYIDDVCQPKLIVPALRDEYFVNDAQRFFYEYLCGESYLLNLPQNGHKGIKPNRSAPRFIRPVVDNGVSRWVKRTRVGRRVGKAIRVVQEIKSYRFILATLNAFHQSQAQGFDMPQAGAVVTNLGSKLRVEYKSDMIPKSVSIWSATSSDRNLRDDRSKPKRLCGKSRWPTGWFRKRCTNEFVVEIPISTTKCQDHTVQAQYEHDGLRRYTLSAAPVEVTGPQKCLPSKTHQHHQIVAGEQQQDTVTLAAEE